MKGGLKTKLEKVIKEKNIYKQDLYNVSLKIMGSVIEVRKHSKMQKIKTKSKDNIEIKYYKKEEKWIEKIESLSMEEYYLSLLENIENDEEINKKLEKRVKLVKNLKDNTRRTEKKIYELCNCNSHLNIFFTLTYKEKMTDRDKLLKDFKKFIDNIKKNYQDDFQYIAIFEKHKKSTYKGGYHVHMLCNLKEALNIGLGELYTDKQGKIKRKRTEEQKQLEYRWGTTELYGKGIWKHGFVDIRKISSKDGKCSDVGSYLCKYMQKDIKDYIEEIDNIDKLDIEEEEKEKLIKKCKNKKRYMCSKGLNRAIELRINNKKVIKRLPEIIKIKKRYVCSNFLKRVKDLRKQNTEINILEIIYNNSILDYENKYNNIYNDTLIKFNKMIVKEDKKQEIIEFFNNLYENGKYELEYEKVVLKENKYKNKYSKEEINYISNFIKQYNEEEFNNKEIDESSVKYISKEEFEKMFI